MVVLPLGTLVAQRIANPSAFSSPANSHLQSASSKNEPILKSWHSTTDGSNGVTSCISSNGSPRWNSAQEAGFAKYDGAGLEKGVRVDRQIEHHEEMA